MSGGSDQVIGNGVYDGTGIRVAVDDTGITRTGTTADCGASGAAYHADSLHPDRRPTDFQNSDASACDDNSHAHRRGQSGHRRPPQPGRIAQVSVFDLQGLLRRKRKWLRNSTGVLSRAVLNDANVSANS